MRRLFWSLVVLVLAVPACMAGVVLALLAALVVALILVLLSVAVAIGGPLVGLWVVFLWACGRAKQRPVRRLVQDCARSGDFSPLAGVVEVPVAPEAGS